MRRIHHGDPDIGATRQCMGLGQMKFRQRILRRIALPRCGLRFLQRIAEIRLYRTDAGISGELAAHGLHRAAVVDAKPADGGADQRKKLGSEAPQSVTARQFVGLRVGQCAVDFGDEFVRDRAGIDRGLHDIDARTPFLLLGAGPPPPLPPPAVRTG